MKILFVALLAFSLFSCSDIAKSKQIERIVAMEQSLDSIQTVLDKERIDTVLDWSLSAYNVEKRIKENYVSDTVDMALGQKMDAYKIMRRSIEPMGKAMNATKKGIIEEREKLASLKKDIENGDGDREKYDEYVLFEEQKVGQLRTLITDFTETKARALKTYNELHDELSAFSYKLLEKKK